MRALLLPACLLLVCLCGAGCVPVQVGEEADDAEQGTGQSQPSSSAPPAPDREAALGTAPQRSFALAGSLAYSLEDSAFLQCGFREQWSLRFEGAAFERFQEAALGEECDLSGCLFVLSGSGDLSGRGVYGQVRSFARELTVTRLTRVERVVLARDLASLNQISCP